MTPTRTAPPTASVAACAGDCDDDGETTVDEILRLVAEALGTHDTGCPAGDANSDRQITVDEIVAAVQRALGGCPAR
jgi:hypothetical protein